MNNKINAWISKEIPEDKKLLFFALTLILTFFSINIANRGLTNLINFINQAAFPSLYSFGIFGILLIIPAALLSIWIIKGYIRLKNRFLQSEIVNRLGFLKYFQRDGIIFKTVTVFFSLLLKLIKILLKLINILVKAISWIMTVITLLIFKLASIYSEGSSSSSSVRSSNSSSNFSSSSGGDSSNTNNNQKIKANAYWQANKKQEAADFAKKRAVDQARYNSDTHHFHDKVNIANLKQREANEEKKRARNL